VSFVDRAFVGRVVKEFGVVSEKNLGIGKQQISLLLAERRGNFNLVFKSSAWSFLGGGLSYLEVPEEAIPTLRQWVGEAHEFLASGAARHPRGSAGGRP
jgi:hypothetical protein